ncbi:MAG: hypothetical protein ACRDGT_10390 [Candidatus Limnocylindria bacterium]
MGYEIWDREAARLMEAFQTEEQALAYLRDMVSDLTPEGAAQTIERMQLVRVLPDGRPEIAEQGVALFKRMYVLALAH